MWQSLDAPDDMLYPWDEKSTYIQKPPFFVGMVSATRRKQMDRQAERLMDRTIDRQACRQTRQRQTKTDTWRDRQASREINRLAEDRQTHRQTDRCIDRHSYRQTNNKQILNLLCFVDTRDSSNTERRWCLRSTEFGRLGNDRSHFASR